MKVVHVITSLQVGGAQSMLRDLVATWKTGPDEHEVIALKGGGAAAAEIEAAGVPVHALGLRRDVLPVTGFARLCLLLRRLRPNLIQTWLYHADLLGGAAGRAATQARVIWGIHHTLSDGGTLRAPTRRIVRINARLSGAVPTRIVCCSQGALETHARRGFRRDRMVVIHNGVDTSRFRADAQARLQVRQELGLPREAILIGMFARFHPQKDHKTLLAAAHLMAARLPEAHLVLAGEGMETTNPTLSRWLADAAPRVPVHLLGLRKDMPRLHAALDLFTLSAVDGEALPLVIAEAMSCGVPCVASDVGDTREMVGEAGICVPPSDPEALADAWTSILLAGGDAYERLSASAAKRAREHFSLDAAATAYRDLYLQHFNKEQR